MLRVEGGLIAIAGEPLLDAVDWHVRPEAKVGLVGRNGTGKTTLLRVLAGERGLDAGRLEVRGGIRVGYLPQHAVSGSERTVWEEAGSQRHAARQRAATLEAARREVEQGEAGAVERLGVAEEAFRLAGGYAEDERIGEVLHGLGFGPDDWHRPCDGFSGGWQMRIALARLLLSESDVLLLDEPTNHLDLVARSWLASFLARTRCAVVIVSHDRYLLDRVVDRVVEVRGGTVHHFTGNLTAWLRQRAERDALGEKAYDAQQREIARLERFVDRFKAKATKAAQARSRQNRLDRMERIERPDSDPPPRYRLPEAPASVSVPLALRRATLGWPGGPDVIVDADLELHRGERLVVLGPNGGGKTTLLHGLSGALIPRSGRLVVGDGARVGVFSQDQAAALPADRTGVEHLTATAPEVPPQRARAALGALGLAGEDALRPIGDLSGGEKARVALAALAVRAHNVLLLDEPTNHLDVVTVEVLVDALSAFDGTIVVVTHDRFLVERLATHVAHVVGGRLEVHEGVRPEDLEPIAFAARRDDEGVAEGAEAHEARKRRARERQRTERRLAEVEAEITHAESELARIDAEMFDAGGDFARLRALDEARREHGAHLELLLGEWEAIALALETDDGAPTSGSGSA